MQNDATLDVALALLERGFVPIRLEPSAKNPKHDGWQTDTPTADKLRRAFARPSNLGIRLGDELKDHTRLIAIDIDIEDHSLIRCVEMAIGEKVPVKRGQKGFTYFVRVDREVKTHKIYWCRGEDLEKKKKGKAAIDLLAVGSQTVLPPSIHPDTGKPYQWVSGTPLHEIDVRTLPVFGESLLDEIKGYCKNPDDPIYALNDMEWRGVGGGGNTHDICVCAVGAMVARKWTDEDIHARITRSKREACERSGMPYNWPASQKVVQEWIDSAREKDFGSKTKTRVDDVPLEFINRYVYVIEIDRMFNLDKNVALNPSVFNNIHARDMGKPWVTMMVHPDLRMVDKLTYAPGQPKFCKEKSYESEAMLDCLNVWTPPLLEPQQGDVTQFVALVKHVLDYNEEAIDHVLSFMAHVVQYPGERINHSLVIQGDQGIGKDTIFQALERAIGTQNTGQVSLTHVESQFNDWLFGRQLIVFQEMLAAGRRNIYNKLKGYITDPFHTINTKHIPLMRVPNRANYVFLTNYRHALSIDPSDRRMWVWYSKAAARGKDFFNDFYKWLKKPQTSAALAQYFLDYDTSKFNPAAPPPMTTAKAKMITASRGEMEQFLMEAAENHSWPMTYDLVSVAHLVGAMRPIMRVSTNMIAEALDQISGEAGELEHRPWFGPKRLRLRAIRNTDKWKNATPEALRDAYMMPLPPQSGDTEGNYSKYTGETREDEGPAF